MIREASHYDAERITEVQLSAWSQAYKDFISPIYLNGLDKEARLERWRSLLEKDEERVFVFEQKDNIQGFTHFNFDTESRLIELVRLYIHPESWREGVGHQLLQHVESEGGKLGASEIWLWVAEENKIGISFYENNGYKIIPNTQVATMFTLDGGPSPEQKNVRIDALDPRKGQFSEVKYHKLL